MSDSYSYSYSYTGSYTDDYDDSYSYSYSYSDTETADKAGAPAAASRPAAKPQQAPTNNKQKEKKAATEEDTGSYSYSYSYSDDYSEEEEEGEYSYSYSDSQTETAAPRQGPLRRGGPTPTPAEAAANADRRSVPPQPKPPAKTVVTKAPAVGANDNDTGSYSYSYSYSYPENDGPRSKRGGGAKGGGGGGGGGSDSYYYSSEDYGSYSYSDEGSYYTDSYSYTGDGSYYYSSSSASAVGAGGKSKARQQQQKGNAAESESYYSDYYSSDYYGSSSGGYYDASESDDYYSGSYRYSESAYYYSDFYTDSGYYDYYSSPSSSYYYDDDDTGSGEKTYADYYSSSYSYTESAASKSASSTTSSYGYSTSQPSVMSVTDENTTTVRDTVVLRAPAQDTPQAPAAPKRCFVAAKSTEDGVWAFLQRLLQLQVTYEARRAAAAAAAPTAAPISFVQRTTAATATPSTAAGAAAAMTGVEQAESKGSKKSKSKSKGTKHKKSKKSKKHGDDKGQQGNAGEEEEVEADEETQDATAAIPTKEGCFSERSLRIAFQVLRFNHFERTEALKNAPVPLPISTMLDIYNTCVAARAKEKVAQAFLAHDTYRSGEVDVAVMGGLLRRLGLGTSPVIAGHRISLAVSSDAVPELLMNVEQLVQGPPSTSTAAAAAAADAHDDTNGDAQAEAAGSPQPVTVQWEVTPVYVARIVRKNAAAKRTTPVQWEHNTIYMGRHVIVRNVTSKAVFERLKTYIEAATYLCVLTNVFTIHDADRGTVTVQYPQFVRSVLLAAPPAGRHAPAAPMKLLVIENLFRAVFHPMEVLHSFEAGRGFPRYLHDWAVESTLQPTKDTEEKRRRNVVPEITADNVHFIAPPATRPPNEGRLSFLLQKVRVSGKPPANARCFCLVSALTSSNVFLPAIEVPVCDIVASKAEAGAYTWVFYDKKHKKHDTIVHVAGPSLDRVYVECCYATTDAPLPAGESAEAGVAESATLADSAVTTVWCAGYAVFALDSAKSASLPVCHGSLLQTDNTATTAATAKEGQSGGGDGAAESTAKKPKGAKNLLRFFAKFGRHQRKMASEQASSIKVQVVKEKKPLAGVEKLPHRFIAFRRHVPMIAQLRAAVEVVGKDTAHALQALRQQAVRYIFAVAADAALLDQLCKLWAHRTKHWSKTERKDAHEQHTQLLACVAALYALNNCCAASKQQFAQALLKEKSMHMTLDAAAPLLPVRV